MVLLSGGYHATEVHPFGDPSLKELLPQDLQAAASDSHLQEEKQKLQLKFKENKKQNLST